ncbi:transposase [Streptomyces clavifer]|uniref:transposase n=1 Tax=Streptomyces clavifer TaxID=68188 RepID=UPI00381DEE55
MGGSCSRWTFRGCGRTPSACRIGCSAWSTAATVVHRTTWCRTGRTRSSPRSPLTAVLDAVRLGAADDAAAVTAGQLCAVVERLVTVGQRQRSDRDVLVVIDPGYDVVRLAWMLRDLPVELVGRLRSDHALWLPTPPRLRGVGRRDACYHSDQERLTTR